MDLHQMLHEDSSLKAFGIRSVNKVEYLKQQQQFRVTLTSDVLLNPAIREPLAQFLEKHTGLKAGVQVVNILTDLSCRKTMMQGLFLTDALKLNFLKEAQVSGEDRLTITHYSSVLISSFRNGVTLKRIETLFQAYYNQRVRIHVEQDEALQPKKQDINVLEEIKTQRREAGVSPLPDAKRKPVAKREGSFRGGDGGPIRKSQEEGVLVGRKIKDAPVSIRELDDNSGTVTIRGEVFKMETRGLRDDKTLLMAYVTDGTGSLLVKLFLKKNQEAEGIERGAYLLLRGNVTYDMYSKELSLSLRDANRLEKPQRHDDAKVKRVELHAHTNMSTMDGLMSAKKLVKTAKEFGHKAVAVTDHGVVQAFPEAMDAAKAEGMKVIYGMEAFVVNDEMNIIENYEEHMDAFVVFDIETTGFSSENDRIIEIGAVKVKDGEVLDRFEAFVNPERPIPTHITELTGITDDMVQDAEPIGPVLRRFHEFIQDAVLVAHNAYFDVGFIRKNLRDLDMRLHHGILDTVPLARYLFPELKRHRLDTIAKHLGIDMGAHHRAVDDAMTTMKILMKAMDKMNSMGIETFAQLNQRSRAEMDVRKLPMFHATILVKSQEGMRRLYELVSASHMGSFHMKPRIRKSDLRKNRNGLLVGSACMNSELMRYILEGRTEEEIQDQAAFYDYLEIQPPSNNIDLLADGRFNDMRSLEELNARIVHLGDILNRPVVATGDVHYRDPEDKILRKILIAAQNFSRDNPEVDLHFRTTQEMLLAFQHLGTEKAYEVVVKNTNAIADQIEEVLPIPKGTFPPKIEGSDEEIRAMTMDKAYEMYGNPLPEVVEKRVTKELNSIIENGYAVLYLISHKLVAKSLSDGYLVGSRGSVGSSLVATFTGITEVNGLPPHYRCATCRGSSFILDGSISSGADLPDKDCPTCGTPMIKDGHDIPFETFLGFEGDKEPDIDLNFSGEYQGIVHKYTEELFGEGYVFKAGTIGTIADKTAFAFVKKYFEEKGIPVTGAEVERLSMGITGVKRTTGQHPGGIMVVPRDNDVHNFTPVQRPADDPNTDITTTHFDYHSISGRLLKLDILGHDDPTMLRMLQDLTGLDPKTIPLNDPKVISLFTSTEALGISAEALGIPVGSLGLPEFGTPFVRGMLMDTRPRNFADLVRISGLSHGTDVWLKNAQHFIREGYTTLENCISTRDDIMVYLMYKGLPAKRSFTIMESVRKGKGLKEEEETIMKEHGVPEWYIESCKRIKYMFPKGHAVAYVMMAVRIAYYKVYHPLAYYAAYYSTRAADFDGAVMLKGESAVRQRLDEILQLGNDASNKEKTMVTVYEIVYEMYKRGFRFKSVDLYASHGTRFLLEDGQIRPPLSALQGVGTTAANSIYNEARCGTFISKEDLRLRCKVSKTVIEALEQQGALEGLDETNQISLFNM